MDTIISDNKLMIGSENKSIISLQNKNKTNIKVFDETKCVIHLLDLSDCLNQYDKFSSDIGNVITNYITDKHVELWKMMKRCDLLEDVSSSGYKSNGRYIIDKDVNSRSIQNFLVVKELCTDYDDYGSIYPDMYTITEFPIGFFDDILINNHMLKSETMRSSWNCRYVCFDTKKLKLDQLTVDEVHHVSTTKKYTLNDDRNFTYNVDHLYILIMFEGIKYMIIQEYSHKYYIYVMSKEISDFTKLFKESKMFRCENITNDIKTIASTENVKMENVCRIIVY